MFRRGRVGRQAPLHPGLLVTVALVVLARAATANAAAPNNRAQSTHFTATEVYQSEHSIDELPRLRGFELQREVPDLVVGSDGPRLRATFGISQRYPLQSLGLEIGVEFALVDWFRTHLLYSPGITGGNGEIRFGNYFEAFVSVRVAEMASERAVDVYPEPRSKRGARERMIPELATWLPSYHRLFLEAGVLSSSVLLGTCFDRCSAPEGERWVRWQARQLVFPLAGLRYVYFIDAVSAKSRPSLSRRIRVEAYAHCLAVPLNDAEEASLWSNDQELKRAAFGGRLGFKIPTCLNAPCLAVTVSAGYVPVPRSVLFQVGTSN